MAEKRKGDLAIHPSVYSTLITRAALLAKLGYQYEGNRDIYQALGYQTDLKYEDYVTLYDRDAIAKAVIDRPVSATWRGGFELLESDDEEETALEKAWKDLYKKLSLLSRFTRLDKLTGIGKYGVLLLGTSDIKKVEDFTTPLQKKVEILYVRPFGEGHAVVYDYEPESTNERYGQPLNYDIKVIDPKTQEGVTLRVHYTRVVHICDGLLEIESEGTPRLEVVFNRIKDLEKIVGASAEMFWRGARPGYQGKIDKDFVLTEPVKETLQEQMDEFEHNLRRMLLNEGISWEALATQVASPGEHVDVQIQMISAVTGIPKRVLTGSERGELASSQDRDNWFDLIELRREEFAEAAIIRPFVNKCIELGVLPKPKEDYFIKWQDLRTPSDQDKANVGSIRANSIKAYASMPTAESIFPVEAFYRYCLGLDDDEIELIGEMKEQALGEEEQATPEEEAAEKEKTQGKVQGEEKEPRGEAPTKPGKPSKKGGEVTENPKQLAERNPCHEPAGTSEGGRFCSTKTANVEDLKPDRIPYTEKDVFPDHYPGYGKWVEAKTKKEAEKIARDTILGLKTVDYDGIDLDVMNAMNKTLNELSHKYKISVNKIGPYSKFGWKVDSPMAANEEGIGFLSKWWKGKRKERLFSWLETRESSGASSNIPAYVAHEFGHVMFSSSSKKASGYKYIYEYVSKVGGWEGVARELSDYAARMSKDDVKRGYRETWCEAFSAYTNDKTKLSKDAITMVENIIGVLKND